MRGREGLGNLQRRFGRGGGGECALSAGDCCSGRRVPIGAHGRAHTGERGVSPLCKQWEAAPEGGLGSTRAPSSARGGRVVWGGVRCAAVGRGRGTAAAVRASAEARVPRWREGAPRASGLCLRAPAGAYKSLATCCHQCVQLPGEANSPPPAAAPLDMDPETCPCPTGEPPPPARGTARP